MSLKNGVKCGRCDRRYSVLRGKCPYCGARRSKAGKRVGGSDSSTWKLVVGLLILLVLIVAVVVLLVTTLAGEESNKPPVIDDEGPTYNQGDGVDNLDDDNDPDLPDEPIIPDEPTTPDDSADVGQAITSVIMKCFGSELSKSAGTDANYDISMGVGDVLNISYETTPVVEDADVKWESADENIIMVLQSGQVTAVGTGTTKLTLTVNGATAVCIVRVS